MEKKIEAFGLDADGKTAKKWQDPFWWSPFRRFRASNTRCPQEEPDLRCGMCGWKPRFLSVFNNMSVSIPAQIFYLWSPQCPAFFQVFMFCYVCLGIFKGEFFFTLGVPINRWVWLRNDAFLLWSGASVHREAIPIFLGGYLHRKSYGRC